MAAKDASAQAPSSVKQHVDVCRAEDVGKANTGQTEGMIRKSALVGCSDKICSTVMIAHPHTGSAIHHHGELDTIVYALRGHGSILYGPDPSQRHDLQPGDHALIPAWVEHQEVNEGDEEVEWIIVRSGKEPIVVNLPEGWGSSQSSNSK